MATQSTLYRAPFGPGGAAAVDAALAEKLLAVALARGGDYADLFFEYRAAGGLVFDEGILKSASRGVSMGLGVRVQKGDATGYAYVERLDWDAMKRAADTAAQIASGGGSQDAGDGPRASSLPRRYELETVTLDVPGRREARAARARRQRRRHAFDPRVVKVEASLAEEVREILVVTSDGTMVHDTQPLRALRRSRHRREGRQAAGRVERRRGAHEPGLLRGQEPRVARPGGGASGRHHARRAGGACRADGGRPRARATAGSCCTRRWGTGSRPTSTARARATTPGRSASRVASDLCTVVDDATLAAESRQHQRRRRGQRAAQLRADREGQAGRLHARPAQRRALRSQAERQRSPGELRQRADAPHDEHHLARGARAIPRRS